MTIETRNSEFKLGEHLSATSVTAGHKRDEDEEIALLDILILVAERKRMVLIVALIFTVGAIIVSLLLPIRYTATLTLMPPQQNSSMSSMLASQIGNMGGMAALAGSSLGLKSPNDMYVAMLKSRTVEDAMVKNFGLMNEYHTRFLVDARKEFEKKVVVDSSGKDGLIHISVDDHDPRRASDLANAYVTQFQMLLSHLAISEASRRRLFFEKELEDAKDKLASAEEAMKETQQQTGLIQLDSQTRALVESAASLRAQIAAREVQIQGMETYATTENSQLVQAKEELQRMKEELAQLGAPEGGATYGDIVIPKGRVPEAGLQYLRRFRDVKYYETIFDIMARQFEAAKLDEAKQGALVQVVDPAVVPEKRSFPRRSLIVLGGAIVGLIVGAMVALLQAGFQRIKQDPLQLEKLHILGKTIWSRGLPGSRRRSQLRA